MSNLLVETIFIGFLSVLLYYLYNYFSFYYNNTDNIVISCISNCVDNKIKKYNNIKFNFNNYLYVFILGIFIHLIIDYIGINKIYCNKVCYDNGKCELVCKMPLN
jgi:hypothetical protein